MWFLIIYFLVQISFFGTILGHFSQCYFKIFRRRPTLVPTLLLSPHSLWCSTNSKSETVMSLLESAVEKHGLPSRVRSNHEVENVAVVRYMFAHPQRYQGIRSFIAGKSCQNEELRDVARRVHFVAVKNLLCVLLLRRCWITGYCV